MDDVTFIIKTLERPYCLVRLVNSIYKFYPDAIVLIADDSKKSCKKIIKRRFSNKNITVFELPNDCGISFGRNYLVKHVKTKYFVLLDDDFEIDDTSNIEQGLNIFKEQGLDIGGGYYRNYPMLCSAFDIPKYFVKLLLRGIQCNNYIGYMNLVKNEFTVKYYTKLFPDFEIVDIVQNFFIADTEVIRTKCLWDDSIKVHEHTPFFLKAKSQGLKVGFIKCMSVKHKPIRLLKYKKYRDRNYVKEWMKLYDINKYIAIIDDGFPRIIEI